MCFVCSCTVLCCIVLHCAVLDVVLSHFGRCIPSSTVIVHPIPSIPPSLPPSSLPPYSNLLTVSLLQPAVGQGRDVAYSTITMLMSPSVSPSSFSPSSLLPLLISPLLIFSFTAASTSQSHISVSTLTLPLISIYANHIRVRGSVCVRVCVGDRAHRCR